MVLFSSPIVGYTPNEDSIEKKQIQTKYLEKVLRAPKEIKKEVLQHDLVKIFLKHKWKKAWLFIRLYIIYQVRIFNINFVHLPFKSSLYIDILRFHIVEQSDCV